jgi:alkylhydroperoxidase/carboxymuconolactone decarboxylase family protein YurZ
MQHFRAMMQAAEKDGATREEFLEVCGVAIGMGGDPSYTYTAMVLDAIDAFT